MGSANIRYLSGFTGSNGALLVAADGNTVLATDGRYTTQAGVECPDVDLLVTRRLGPALVEWAMTAGLRLLAVERHHVTLAAFDSLVEAGGAAVSFTDVGQAVEDQRVVKDDDEIRAITTACQVTDEVFAAVLPQLRTGITERAIAGALVAEMQARDTEPSFEAIVAFGPNSAVPHHRPSGRSLERGDLVKLDFGAMVDGYHADMTRTVVVGPAADWQRELHDLVRRVQQQCRAAAVPGAVPVELDGLARQQIESAGHDVAHGLGHGVGLEIHESPFLVPGSTADRLVSGVPVTIEPGVYLPGRGGVRIEDTVVVREGGAEPLTTSSRDLIEI